MIVVTLYCMTCIPAVEMDTDVDGTEHCCPVCKKIVSLEFTVRN